MTQAWNAPPGRYFLAYRARHGYRALIGNGVVDEFRTTSAPLFVCPTALLGKIYDAGMALADRRDVEAPLDLGWPPLCMGLDGMDVDLPANWREELLDTLTGELPGSAVAWPVKAASAAAGKHEVHVVSSGGEEPADRVRIIGTTAPLLPGQLERLADLDNSAFTVAIATGNRVTRMENAQPQTVNAVSEAVLAELVAATRSLL
jgi:hypothetical protein